MPHLQVAVIHNAPAHLVKILRRTDLDVNARVFDLKIGSGQVQGAAIHLSASRGNLQLLTRLLQDQRIDVELCASDGQTTAIDLATATRQLECVKVLEDKTKPV